MLSVPILTEQLATAVKAAAKNDTRLIVIDLRDVSFCGSTGLAALVACRDDCARWDIAVRVVASNTAVLRPIAVTGLDGLLPVYPTVDVAVWG